MFVGKKKTEIFTIKNKSEELISNSLVYLNQDVQENGFLFLGATTLAPLTEKKAFRIKRFDKTPSLKGNKYTRKAWL